MTKLLLVSRSLKELTLEKALTSLPLTLPPEEELVWEDEQVLEDELAREVEELTLEMVSKDEEIEERELSLDSLDNPFEMVADEVALDDDAPFSPEQAAMVMHAVMIAISDNFLV